MDWDFEIKLRVWKIAILRRKDAYMRAGLSRWKFGILRNGCWGAL